MERRREDNARINAFAQQIALRELRKLDPKVEEDGADGSFPTTVERAIDTYLPYRDSGILERQGGWADQDPEIIEAYRELDHRVAWYIVNEQKTAIGDLPEYRDAKQRSE